MVVIDEAIPPSVLVVALAPVLRDLHAAGIRPRIGPTAWGDVPEQVTAMSWWPDGSGSGVSVLTNESAARNTAAVAGQLQDTAVESLPGMGRSAVWPECPDHPN